MRTVLRGIGLALLFAVVLFGAARAFRAAAAYLALPGEPPPGEADSPTLAEWDLLASVQERDLLAAEAASFSPSLDPFHHPAEPESAAPAVLPAEAPAAAETARPDSPAVAEAPAPEPAPLAASSPPVPDRAGGKEYAIPVVASRTGTGPDIRVVLDFGTVQSPPLAAGEEFRGWRVSGFSDGRAFLAHRGVTYTLPLP